MDFFRILIRRILNKIPLKLLLFIFIIMLSFYIISSSNVFATDGSSGGGNGGGGFRGEYEPVFDNNFIQYLNDAIYTYDNYKPLENNTFFFYDEYANSCRCISWTGTDTGLVDYNQQSYYDVSIYNWRDIYLYTVNLSDGSVSKTTKSNARGTTFNTLFELPNTFNKYNFMFACYKSGYQNASVIDSYNNSYMKKTYPFEPFAQYENSSFIVDDCIIINPASTRVGENSYIPFDLELWNADGGNIGENVEHLSINLSTLSSYWDSEDLVYKIPFSTYLALWASNDGNYELIDNLFTDNHFYMKKQILTFSVEDGNFIFPTNPDNPDNPDNPITPDYTQDINNINNSINNSNIDNMSSDFSQFNQGFNIQDPSGIDAIFQKLYNAFCTDNVIDLTLTIPFVNKTFTISSSNISNNFPQAVKSIVSVFVWGIVGLWVLKDIRNIVNKIAEGNPENVGSDVKKEVL